MGIYSDVLKELRRDKNLTQRDMGMHFGISATTYCLYENGNRRMSVSMLCELADVLGTSTDYILGRTDVCTPYAQLGKKRIYSDILKDLRRKNELTQKEIGGYLGISASMYCLYENGKRRMTLEMLNELANLLYTSTDYILGRVAEDGMYTPSTRKKRMDQE